MNSNYLQQLTILLSVLDEREFLGRLEALAADIRVKCNPVRSTNKLVVTGIGKSGFVGMKVVASLQSVGLNAIYLDSAAALHGDIGMIRDGDALLAITNSGTTIETVSTVDQALRNNDLCFIACISSGEPEFRCDHLLQYPKVDQIELMKIPTMSLSMAATITDLLVYEISASLPGLSLFETFKANHPGGAIGHSFAGETK